jgi:hypothetical protein
LVVRGPKVAENPICAGQGYACVDEGLVVCVAEDELDKVRLLDPDDGRLTGTRDDVESVEVSEMVVEC